MSVINNVMIIVLWTCTCSLLVSPDPDQPLMAVVVLLQGVDRRTVRIYNYRTKELRQELELHGKCEYVVYGYSVIIFCKLNTDTKIIPAVAAFHPSGEYVDSSIIPIRYAWVMGMCIIIIGMF